MKKTEEKERKIKIPKKKRIVTEEQGNKEKIKRTKVKFKIAWINLLVVLSILAVTFGLLYYFQGLISAGIVTICLCFVLLIGYFLDKPKSKTKKRKVLKIILGLILVVGIIGLLAGCWFIYYIVKHAPDFNQELFKAKESTILYDSQGNEFAKIGSEMRENIEYDEISEVFIDALIATEDSRFFQHNGFDLMRFVKAAVGQAMGKGDAGGGSTLTMQLSKNTLTDTNAHGWEGIVRKFTDIYISIFQIERNYTKEQIIEYYANNHNLSGIIFGKRSSKKGWLEGLKLSLIEIFLLIILNLGLNTTGTKNIILYSFILLATTIGSIIGVNKNNLAN